MKRNHRRLEGQVERGTEGKQGGQRKGRGCDEEDTRVDGAKMTLQLNSLVFSLLLLPLWRERCAWAKRGSGQGKPGVCIALTSNKQ